MRTVFASRASVLAVAAILSAAAPAYAQSAPQATPETSASQANAAQVADIVVTAQRIQQSLQKVPVAVDVVSGDELKSRDIHDLVQIGLAVPTFQTGGDNAFAVRGVGSQIFTENVDSSVGVAVDEVSLGVPLFMSNGILDDIARVEVLEGPQGLLFGRNATAGLLNIVSNRPSFKALSGSISGEFDDRDSLPGGKTGYVTKGTLNVPVSDNAAFRFNMLYSDQDPITHFTTGAAPGTDVNQTRLAFRGKFLVEPTPDLSIYLIGDYSKERGLGGIFDRSYRSVGAGSIIGPAIAADGVTAGPDNFLAGNSGATYRSVDTYGLSANVSYKISDGLTVSNIAAWRAYKLGLGLDTDFTATNEVDVNKNHSSFNQYSDELRLAVKANNIDGQIGAYIFKSDLDSDANVDASLNSGIPNLIGSDNVISQSLRSVAAFGQFQYHLTDAFQLIAGARVTNDRITINETQNVLPYVLESLGPPNLHLQEAYSHTNFSYKLGAQYNFTPDVMGYATYSTGYKGPSFNGSATVNCAAAGNPCGVGVTQQNLTVYPETVKNFELGLKSNLLDRHLRLNLAVFRGDFSHFQIQSFDAATLTYPNGNAASVRSQGIEFTANAKLLKGLSLNAGASLLDSKFRSYGQAPCYIGQPDCVGGVANDTGTHVPLSPNFTSNVEAIYEFAVGGSTTAVLEGSFNHRSSITYAAGNPGPLTLGSADTFGASVALKFDPNFEVSVFCKNCGDKHIPSALAFDSVDGPLAGIQTVIQQWGYNSVRTIGLSATAKF